MQERFQKIVDEARPFAKVYNLSECSEKNDIMVIDEVECLDLEGAFHTGFALVCFCKGGNASFVMNNRPHALEKGCLLVNFGDALVHDFSMSADFSCIAIAVSQDLMQESMMQLMQLWPYLLYVMENPVLKLGDTEMQRLILNYQLIINRLSQAEHHFKREATIANMQACYLDVCDFLKQRVPKNEVTQSRAYGIFDKFIRLVANHYVNHRDVQWYASEMSLTPKYLSEVVKDVSGRTAGQWITNFVITEIKSLLKNSDLSIKEIAVEMNFSDQSFLGKYFKNAVGMSPLEYRCNRQ